MAKHGYLSVRLDKPVKDRVNALAAKRKITTGELLRRVLVEELRREGA